MAKCYDTIHKGHRPVTLLVAAVCLFPPVFTMRRYHFCTHPVHIGKVIMRQHQPPDGKPRGVCRLTLLCDRRKIRVRVPAVNASREHELCFIDALRMVALQDN